jgi:hypothetical protein
MALFLDGPLPLEDVITFTQQVPLPSNNKLTQMFPTRHYATDEIDMAIITQTNRAAKYRNWDGAFWTAPRDTGLEKRVKMLPLGARSSEIGEYERRQIEFAAVGGTIQSILHQAIYNDLENQTHYVQNRVELAWGDVLSDGILTINENGVQQQLDFGIPTNQVVTPAGALWSDTANSNPLIDLEAWYDIYVALNGSGPGQFLCSLTTARQLQSNTHLINQIRGAQTGVTNVTLAEISGLFNSYDLPSISMDNVYNSFFDVDGVKTAPLAANKFLFLPTDMGELGFTAWGTPTTVMELNANNVQVETAAGIIGILVREEAPPFNKTTYVDAVSLPVLADPRKLLVATVA